MGPPSAGDVQAEPTAVGRRSRIWSGSDWPTTGRALRRDRGEAGEVPRAEYVLAEALKLARQDATVARALPVALYRNRERLDLAELRRLAGERGEGRALGFFLELTAELAGDPSLARAARPLRPRRPRQRATQFFPVRSRLERRLAEDKTPSVARRWDFRMNMGLDTFEGMFRKAVG